MNGVLLINKPKGMTSHDVIYKVRRKLGTKKVGHTGTLDPDVTGLLVVVVGQATKLTEILQTREKGYQAEVTLGVATETEDSSGEITGTSPVEHITTEDIDRVILDMHGAYQQMVPLYSSVKVGGWKLYEYARNGIPVERPIKKVHIHSIERTSEVELKDKRVSFNIDVRCSKGTYIRTLAVDIGRKLGVDAHMSGLVRSGSCGFLLADAVDLNEMSAEDIIPIESFLTDDPIVELSDNKDLLFEVKNGQKVSSDIVSALMDKRAPRVLFKNQGVPIGIYQVHGESDEIYRPFKMFNL